MKQKQINPTTSFEFIEGWFEKTANLWVDGLEHLRHLKSQRDELLAACKAVAEAWQGTDNMTDPDADGHEVLQKVKAAISKAEGK